MKMVELYRYKIYSGGISGKAQVAPTIAQHNNYLFTVKNIFFRHMAQCILMYLAPGATREKIHVGVNTLSRVYNLKHKTND